MAAAAQCPFSRSSAVCVETALKPTTNVRSKSSSSGVEVVLLGRIAPGHACEPMGRAHAGRLLRYDIAGEAGLAGRSLPCVIVLAATYGGRLAK